MNDYWAETSRDVETEQASLRLARARVEVASVWPFLAAATTPRDFDHRKALMQPNIDAAVAKVSGADRRHYVDVHAQIEASLVEDWEMLHTAAPQHWTGDEVLCPRCAGKDQSCGTCNGQGHVHRRTSSSSRIAAYVSHKWVDSDGYTACIACGIPEDEAIPMNGPMVGCTGSTDPHGFPDYHDPMDEPISQYASRHTAATCPVCNGSGSLDEEECSNCKGQGEVPTNSKEYSGRSAQIHTANPFKNKSAPSAPTVRSGPHRSADHELDEARDKSGIWRDEDGNMHYPEEHRAVLWSAAALTDFESMLREAAPNPFAKKDEAAAPAAPAKAPAVPGAPAPGDPSQIPGDGVPSAGLKPVTLSRDQAVALMGALDADGGEWATKFHADMLAAIDLDPAMKPSPDEIGAALPDEYPMELNTEDVAGMSESLVNVTDGPLTEVSTQLTGEVDPAAVEQNTDAAEALEEGAVDPAVDPNAVPDPDADGDVDAGTGAPVEEPVEVPAEEDNAAAPDPAVPTKAAPAVPGKAPVEKKKDEKGKKKNPFAKGSSRTAAHNIDVFTSGGGSDGARRHKPACLEDNCGWNGKTHSDYGKALSEASDHRNSNGDQGKATGSRYARLYEAGRTAAATTTKPRVQPAGGAPKVVPMEEPVVDQAVVARITAGVLATNPGMSPFMARDLALQTVTRFPGVQRK